MSNMKCPFCQQELEICGKYTDGTSKVWCSKCNLFGDSKLFDELISKIKALDVAVGVLNKTKDGNVSSLIEDETWIVVIRHEANKALEQINEITKGNK